VIYHRPEYDRHNYDEAYLRARIVGALRAVEGLGTVRPRFGMQVGSGRGKALNKN
jgi:hypothetical protein